MQILPIGEQNFTEIRKNNWLYVDKTKHLQDMVKLCSAKDLASSARKLAVASQV